MEKFKGFVYLLIIIGMIWFLFQNRGGSVSNNSGRFDEYNMEEEDSTYEITSDSWNCTSDCSGHEAGYEWAADQGITDPYDCDGHSDSFIEGCQAYANEAALELEYSNRDFYDDRYIQ